MKNNSLIAAENFVSKSQYAYVVQIRPYDAESSASLYTGAKSKLGNRALDEVEKDIFIALSGKGGHSGLMPLKPSVPTWGG